MDGPEQGEQHRAGLALGPRKHQHFTLREADTGTGYGKAFAEHGHRPSQTAAVTGENLQGSGERLRKSFPHFQRDREEQPVETPLSPSSFPEASQMVCTASVLPFCPSGVYPLSSTPANPPSLWPLPLSLQPHLSHLKSHFPPLRGSPTTSRVLT